MVKNIKVYSISRITILDISYREAVQFKISYEVLQKLLVAVRNFTRFLACFFFKLHLPMEPSTYFVCENIFEMDSQYYCYME